MPSALAASVIAGSLRRAREKRASAPRNAAACPWRHIPRGADRGRGPTASPPIAVRKSCSAVTVSTATRPSFDSPESKSSDNGCRPPPRFAGASFVPLVDQESLARREQERPESAALGVDGLKRPQLEQSLEERLSKILCFVYIAHAAANVRVKRIPIRLTKLGKGPTRVWPSSIAGREDHAPMRRGKLAPPGSGLFVGSHCHSISVQFSWDVVPSLPRQTLL